MSKYEGSNDMKFVFYIEIFSSEEIINVDLLTLPHEGQSINPNIQSSTYSICSQTMKINRLEF